MVEVSPLEIIKKSVLYRASAQIVAWANKSYIISLLNDQRVLVGILGGMLILSLLRILSSGLHVAIQFFSFALLFVVLAAVTWQYTEPFTNT